MTVLDDPTEQFVDAELERQVRRIVESGQLAAGTWTADELRARADRLRPALVLATRALPAPTGAGAPFVLVLPRLALPPSAAVTTLNVNGHRATLAKGMDDLDRFSPVAGLDVPEGLYAAVDVRRGDEYRGRTPEDGLAGIAAEGRSPLTLDEGLALVTVRPEALEKNHCFQTPGSRAGDRRVPGIWLSGRAPRVGFCWVGNHHTWLGVASCARRVGAH
jgi:hypothetical protein